MATSEIEKIESPLPIDESIGLQGIARRVQQAGIIFIFLIILLAAFGFFGQGVLSLKKVQEGGHALTYEKFSRFGGESTLVFDLAAANDSITQIELPAAYLEYFKIETIVPEPDKNSVVNNWFIYNFNGSNARRITFYLLPAKTGNAQATIKANHVNFTLSHFIYP